MLRTALLLLVSLVCCLNAAATTHYTLKFSEPQAHYADVTIKINLQADSADLKMPVWIPGSYMVREFSRMVESFQAADPSGQPLKWQKVRKNTWRVYQHGGGTAFVSYRVYCNELGVRTSFIDFDRAFINGSSVFMYPENHLNDSCIVKIHPALGWRKISTGLDSAPDDPFTVGAADYDVLADSPIMLGNQTIFTFKMQGIPHEVAMMGQADYDSVKIKNDLIKITTECTRIFGSNPVKRYVFFVLLSPNGGGGLEHRNSTALMARYNTFEKTGTYNGFMSLCAHEYFHLWLVKRIRDINLGPFDYDNEVYTRQLWLYEGFTSFYDDYILYRTGIYSEAEYLDILKGNIQRVANDPGNAYQSLTESSFDAWIKYYRPHENSGNSTISYYTKGGVNATLMHLDLLHVTAGEKNLDNLMQLLYNQSLSMNRGYTDEELVAAFSDVWGVDMHPYFEKYIEGTDPLPFEECLGYAGMEMIRTDGSVAPQAYLGVTTVAEEGGLFITGVKRDSPAWKDGLNTGDEIMLADTVPGLKMKAYLDEKRPGDEIIFRVKRMGVEKELMVTLGEDPAMRFELNWMKKPDALQKQVRKAWMGTK